jgi:hypothetical protein
MKDPTLHPATPPPYQNANDASESSSCDPTAHTIYHRKPDPDDDTHNTPENYIDEHKVTRNPFSKCELCGTRPVFGDLWLFFCVFVTSLSWRYCAKQMGWC